MSREDTVGADPDHDHFDRAEGRATVKVHHQPLAYGRSVPYYTWHGPTHWPVALSDYRLDVDIKDLPWPLVLVEERYIHGDAIYARTDGHHRPHALFTQARYAVARRLRRIAARCVMTLHVWGLAHVPGECVPSWRDIGRRHPFEVQVRGGGEYHAPIALVIRAAAVARRTARRLRARAG